MTVHYDIHMGGQGSPVFVVVRAVFACLTRSNKKHYVA